MTPADAIDWCLHRNADAPTCARLREIFPAVAAADATNRALLERCADLEKEVARLTPAVQRAEYGCYIDLDPGMQPDGCVIDSGRYDDCAIASRGLRDKMKCEYWQPIKVTR